MLVSWEHRIDRTDRKEKKRKERKDEVGGRETNLPSISKKERKKERKNERTNEREKTNGRRSRTLRLSARLRLSLAGKEEEEDATASAKLAPPRKATRASKEAEPTSTPSAGLVRTSLLELLEPETAEAPLERK